jgi:hypothetical protein
VRQIEGASQGGLDVFLALLGEVDILSGQMLCPRSPADSLAAYADTRPTKEDWVIAGICAYVPQV